MSFSLGRFDVGAMLRCGLDLRRAVQASGTLEEAAGAVVQYFHDECRDEATGERQCVLVRFFKTHPFGGLPDDLQAFACRMFGPVPPHDDTRCLVLLATAGAEPEWNDRRLSRGHQAIPLPSAEVVERSPMVAQLIRELGLDVAHVVAPRPELIRGLEGKTHGVFHVAEAAGSPYIPAQEAFVLPHGVRSVVGCGGIVHDGDLFALVLFSRVPIPAESAERFRQIALQLKIAILPVATSFAPAAAVEAAPPPA
ncbi:MAG TPA: hypothetical protein VHG91_17160 [Longimicrobium sp.]|nr:hypothetical protein [Longimicrobium sp.]